MASTPDKTGVVDTRALADREDGLGGTGGSAGGGTIAGSGDTSGGTLAGEPGLPEASDDEIAREAAALGGVDGTLADATGQGSGTRNSLGEAVGTGAGRADVGSGTPGDTGDLGGGGGGTGPAGTGRPGGA